MVVSKGATETNAEGLVFDIVFPRIKNLMDESREGELKGGKEICWRFEEPIGKIAPIVSQIIDIDDQSRLFPP